MEIVTYREADHDEVVALVLHCQNDEAHLGLSLADQPDLLDVYASYFEGDGCFWVAKEAGHVAGCIGLMNCRDGAAILKKFFVYERFRGVPCHLGQRLFGALIRFARERGVRKIVLDTHKRTARAHKFYARAGFAPVAFEDVLVAYDAPFEDSDYFMLELS